MRVLSEEINLEEAAHEPLQVLHVLSALICSMWML